MLYYRVDQHKVECITTSVLLKIWRGEDVRSCQKSVCDNCSMDDDMSE